MSSAVDLVGTAAHWVMRFILTRTTGAFVLVVAALTSCGDATHSVNTATPPTQSVLHSGTDVDFARNMIPHHQQAVVLAALVPARTANPELRVMAAHIGADQQSEIRTLNGLLADWGEPPVDPAGVSSTPHHDDMTMRGMVDQPTLDRLRILDDDAFDTLWTTSMIGHHQGAVEMARDEIARGQSADAVHVATLIVIAQQREIAMMTHLISASQ